MEHRLRPLLNPSSIAVYGASARAGSVGNEVLKNLLQGGFRGDLFAVNPRYESVLGVTCFPSLSALPMRAEQVIFAVSDERIEAALEDAIAHGARAATIYSTLLLANDTSPLLVERIRSRAVAANLLLAGGNGMGFYNYVDRVWACGFDARNHGEAGNVVLLSQSGSGMAAILDCEERLRFSFAASTGQELVVGIEDYLDYVLDRPETRVVGLFMETARKPAQFIACCEKAQARGIPLVALKVGRTALAAELALSHSGALVGSDGAYAAVFERYGVQRVNDLDELATTLIMFAQPHPVGDGGLVTLHDSGGERQLLIDLAEQHAVPLAELTANSVQRLEEILDPGLPAVNPLDAWSAGGPNALLAMQQSFATLLSDPGAAIGAVVHARGPGSSIYPAYRDYLLAGHAVAAKPAFLVAARQGSGSDTLALSMTHQGTPVLDGVQAFLAGARCLFGFRDHQKRAVLQPPALPAEALQQWRDRLHDPREIGEAEASTLLTRIGIPMAPLCRVDSEDDLLRVLPTLLFPVVLKTAAPGISHKTECGGVVLDIVDTQQLQTAYAELRDCLGPHALIAPMLKASGVEMILGISRDAQFGPLVVMGFGGVHAELLRDVITLLPPFDVATAHAALSRLRMRALLDGMRGAPACDVDAFCDAAARLSVLADACRDRLDQLDINPLRVMQHGCCGLDALVVQRHD